MGLHVAVEVFPSDDGAKLVAELSGGDIEGSAPGGGELLEALQHVAGLMLRRELGPGHNLIVDGGGYRRLREAQLVEEAKGLAERAKRTGSTVMARAMSSYERRVVHVALEPMGVVTRSEGEGAARRLVVHPPHCLDQP
jgi:spoIIIJ-associated protein